MLDSRLRVNEKWKMTDIAVFAAEYDNGCSLKYGVPADDRTLVCTTIDDFVVVSNGVPADDSSFGPA